MELWHEQTHRYHSELKEFKKLTAETMNALGKDHSLLLKDLEGAAARVDHVEREMDYLETQTSPRACANKADKVLEQGAWSVEESRTDEEEEEDWEEVRARVSGEKQGGAERSQPSSAGRMPLICYLHFHSRHSHGACYGYI